MKIITLHCDYIRFKPLKKAIKSVNELTEIEKEEKEVKDPLVVLTAVEKGDNDNTLKDYIEAIKKTAVDVKTNNIVLYPYAHLSSNLSDPATALDHLIKAESILSKEKYNVSRAPFGYYKTFELKVKGHPLSELSKQFGQKDATDVSTIKVPKAMEIEVEENISKLLSQISRSKLDTSKLKDNDHRILGQKLDLFSFSEVAPGMVFWHNNGLIIYNELVNFWREIQMQADYQEISTPQIMDKKLWLISGHWNKYKENIFLSEYENKTFAVKPMNCPGGMLVFKSKTRSYKDLPLRVAELGVVHRQELSGVLSGLFRLIRFTQDDAHIFCKEDQLEIEIENIIKLIDTLYSKFGFTYYTELSTRPEKRIGEEKLWDTAEKILESVLKKKKMKYKINKGDGAFYGPKIDFHIKDSLERTWQCATIQLDFAMPQRFELEYTEADNKKKTPVMLHRVLYGSIERFIGVLLEHLNGNLPLWLSPIQVRITDFTDRNTKAAAKVLKELKDKIPSLRIDSDFSSTTVADKIRNATLMKIPFILVIGDKEEENKTLAVRSRDGKVKYGVKIDSFIDSLKDSISKRL